MPRRNFNPRTPRGGRQGWPGSGFSTKYFNPRTPRGGRRVVPLVQLPDHDISIHAPREGGDLPSLRLRKPQNISIHAPREGGDPGTRRSAPCAGFQSTHPARGATLQSGKQAYNSNISIHAPREGGDRHPGGGAKPERHFNPRTPRGGRLAGRANSADWEKFQSTHHARGATAEQLLAENKVAISIHAPREGGDLWRGSKQF